MTPMQARPQDFYTPVKPGPLLDYSAFTGALHLEAETRALVIDPHVCGPVQCNSTHFLYFFCNTILPRDSTTISLFLYSINQWNVSSFPECTQVTCIHKNLKYRQFLEHTYIFETVFCLKVFIGKSLIFSNVCKQLNFKRCARLLRYVPVVAVREHRWISF